MFEPNADASPLNPIPPIVAILAVTMIGIELVLQLAEAGFIGGPEAVGWRVNVIRELGFFDDVFEYMRTTQTYDWTTLHQFFTYPFVNFSFTGAIFSSVLVLALGKAVGDEFHPLSVIFLFFTCSALGVLALGFFRNVGYPVIGGFGAVYGLIGAYTWMLWLKAGATGTSRIKAFQLIGFLTVLQLIYHFGFGGGDDWIAKLVGFVVGFFLSFVLAPDGRERMRRWLGIVRRR